MSPDIVIHICAGALATMTVEQLQALQVNVVRPDVWQHITRQDPPVFISGGGADGMYLGVTFPDIFLGFERDGYTHS